MYSELELPEEPLGPFQFVVFQAEPQQPQTHYDLSRLNKTFEVIFQFWENPNAADEPVKVGYHRFLMVRDLFLLSVHVIRATLERWLQLSGVSEPGIEQIVHFIHSHAHAIANDDRNSNQPIISLSLFLLFLGDHFNQGDYENRYLEVFGDGNPYQNEHELARRAIEESMHDNTTYNPVPATKSSIEALEKVTLEDASLASTELCLICMEQLSSVVELTRMPCSHLYHGDCLVQWLTTNHLCPLCRFPMPCENP